MWHKSFDTGGHVGALLTDFFEAFDYIDHKLLSVKLHAYGSELMNQNVLTLTVREANITNINLLTEVLLGVPKYQFVGHYYLALTYVIIFTILMV